MSFEVRYTEDFKKAVKRLAKRHKSIKADLGKFVQSVQENPFQGAELFPGARKIRMAIASKGGGKSGGARVITYTVVIDESNGIVYLIDIYDKAEYSTVDQNILKAIVENFIEGEGL